MLRNCLLGLLLLGPGLAQASPMRYELNLLPNVIEEGYASWDHLANMTPPAGSTGCDACHAIPTPAFLPSGTVTSAGSSAGFLHSPVKIRFYGDTGNIGLYPDPHSLVTGLNSTASASGRYLASGRATVSVPLTPTAPLTTQISQISAGGDHTCAVTASGSVLCWGVNTQGQLGIANDSSGAPIRETVYPAPVIGLPGPVKSVVTSEMSGSCALTTAGAVWCWGYDVFGALGFGPVGMSSPVALPVTGMSSGVAAISAGTYATCALMNTGGVQCWGADSLGALGDGNPAAGNVGTPVQVQGLSSGVAQIALGDMHSCALTSAGAVLCWGYNYYGELGNGTTTNASVPVPVTGLGSGVVAIAAGGEMTCALDNKGQVWCWGGLYGTGYLGNGSTTGSTVPVQVSAIPGTVTSIATGGLLSCALTSSGAPYCWGGGYDGNPWPNYFSLVPVPIAGHASGVAALTLAGAYGCMLNTTGNPLCWGGNANANLGSHYSDVPLLYPSFYPAAITDIPVPVLAGPGTVSQFSAAFAASAGLFVATDNTHHSVGIGSGWPNIVPTYPGGILSDVYPSAATVSALDSYDLTTPLTVTTGHSLSNTGFPTTWPIPAGLPLVGGGSLQIDPIGPVDSNNVGTQGNFSATALTPLSALTASGGWSGVQTAASVSLQGSLTLAATGKPFTPASDDLVIGFGPYTALIPAGSLAVSGTQLSYSGSLQGASAQIVLNNTASNIYTFTLSLGGVDLTGVTAPASLDLYAGDNAGSIVPTLLPQTISPGTAPALAVAGSATLAAVAASGLPLTYTLNTPSTCTLNGNLVTGIAVGTCTIALDQPGNTLYAPATEVLLSLTVTAGKQAITFGAAPALSFGGSSAALLASASSGLPVVFATSTPTVCTVSGATVAPVAAGTCTVTANQAGNANYLPAPAVTQTIVVAKASQTISFGAAPALVAGGTGSVTASAGSALAVSFTSSTPTVCTVSGSTVKALVAGTCTIVASQAGNANYAAAPNASQSITVTAAVTKKSQTITFGAAPALKVGVTATVTVTASSGLTVTLTTSTPKVCSVTGLKVKGLAIGTCTVTANQAGNASYAAAPAKSLAIAVK